MSMTIKINNTDNENANYSDFIDSETMFIHDRNLKMEKYHINVNDPEITFLDYLIEE